MVITKQGFGVGHFVRVVLLGSMAVALAGTATTTSAATTTTAATASSSPSAGSDKFPHLGMISTGGPQKYGSSFQTYAAKFNVVIMAAAGKAGNKVRAIAKRPSSRTSRPNPTVNTRVFQYVALN